MVSNRNIAHARTHRLNNTGRFVPINRWKRSLPMAIDKHDVTVADSTRNQLYLHLTPIRRGNGHLFNREWLANLTTHRCFQFLFLKAL
jgi:hypothetical protein